MFNPMFRRYCVSVWYKLQVIFILKPRTCQECKKKKPNKSLAARSTLLIVLERFYFEPFLLGKHVLYIEPLEGKTEEVL